MGGNHFTGRRTREQTAASWHGRIETRQRSL